MLSLYGTTVEPLLKKLYLIMAGDYDYRRVRFECFEANGTMLFRKS